MFPRFHFKSLRNWLTLWFLILALLPVVITGGISYFQRVHAIRTQVYAKLTAIRDLKVDQVSRWVDERFGDIWALSSSLESMPLRDLILQPQSRSEVKSSRAEIRKVLRGYVIDKSHYREVFIVGAKTGKILVSSDISTEGASKWTDPYFTGALQAGNIFIKDVYFSNTLKAPGMAFSIPLYNPNDHKQVLAVLVARVALEKSVYKMLLDRTGLGETGETLVVNKEGLALNELRWHENAPLNLKITSQPAVLAAQGQQGIIESVDYRGEKVLATYQYIPQLEWGFVAKQDSAEAFAPIREMFFKLMIIFVLSAGIIIFCAFAIAKRIVAPIVKMKNVASRQQKGELAARIETDRADELGYLAQSFNDLAASVEGQLNIQRSNSTIFKSIVAADSLSGFSQQLLKKLISITDSQLATFYLRNDKDQSFELLTSIGVDTRTLKTFNAEIQAGEFGVALESKQIERITDIPEDTRFLFKTLAGQAVPREIITIPLIERGEVVALVSLASLKNYSAECLKILQICRLPVSTALVNILANEKTQQLAAELAEKNDELQMNTEELQAQTEELREQATELRGTASELEARRTQVEEADRLKSEFLSNMSHELRTPLNSVLALSQLMIARGTGKNPLEEKNFLEVIERNGRQLLSLINDILDLAKIESGRMDIFPTDFDVRLAVDRALCTMRPLAEKKELDLVANIETAGQMVSDEEKLIQILLNLLSNAVKFTDQGEVRLEVNATETHVSFMVSDTGIGMLPEDLPHIFDEFRQADGTTTRKHEGTGLGLSICQKLAGLLGGQIRVESIYGEGSIFTLELPLQIPSSNDNLPTIDFAKQKKRTEVESGHALQRTVLVIDDENEVRDLVSKHLTEAGYEVVLARSGREGLRLAKELQPFAITLDVLMPEMDGWEALKALKNDPATADIPVIMLSVSEDLATAKALGTAGYLTKPVNRNLLCAELDKLSAGPLAKVATEQPKILVVEDNEIAALQIKTALEENGYEVTLASGGAEGLESIQRAVPDAMVLDLMMPGVDGFEVLETLRSTLWTEQLPVLVLTAKELTVQDRARLKHNHVQQLIQKGSVNKAQLVAAVGSLLESTLDKPEAVVESVAPKVMPSGNRIVLVVEDNPDNLLTITATLAGGNLEIVSAPDGQQGVEKALELRPGLILMDMQLPVMNGMDATRQIKALAVLSGIPIIALTANAMKGDREAMLAAGCVDYLSKPFDPADLERLVAKWLS